MLTVLVDRFSGWQKANYFNDRRTADEIAEVRNGDPELCGRLGRKISSFDPVTWYKIRSDIMESGAFAKFWVPHASTIKGRTSLRS
jgi:predicted NAD-dependent protein-ADP-ribosyltransferase YbiA (DUF1768 family)